MLQECVSSVPFINWGQVISVTAENVLSADKVMLTFFGEESAKIYIYIYSLPGGRKKKKLNCLSTALVKNENQSASPQFTLTAPQRLWGILILILTNALSFSSLALWVQLQLH